jgi:hypothetical protein
MRFDVPVYMRTVEKGAYDALTGDYAPETVREVKVYASVTETGTDALKLIYGDIKQNSLTVRLQNHYNEAFDNIRIGEKIYRVDRRRRLRTKETFIVSGVQ